MDIRTLLSTNLEKRLRQNPYPGRGIVIGLNQSGTHLIQIYWIMGRSANSRNRIFKLEDEILQTHPCDPHKVENPELIIYNALRHFNSDFIVSNGSQTDTIYALLARGESFETALLKHTFEPDRPNYTPRIAALLSLRQNNFSLKMAIVKKSIFDDSTIHHFFHYASLVKGIGWCLHTYQNDGNPLPAFEGEPYPVPLGAKIEATANDYWQTLNETNKISLVVKAIDVKTRKLDYQIINKY